jgi:coproporphyrinogen III oxidase
VGAPAADPGADGDAAGGARSISDDDEPSPQPHSLSIAAGTVPPLTTQKELRLLEREGPRWEAEGVEVVCAMSPPLTRTVHVEVAYATVDGTSLAGTGYLAREGTLRCKFLPILCGSF